MLYFRLNLDRELYGYCVTHMPEGYFTLFALSFDLYPDLEDNLYFLVQFPGDNVSSDPRNVIAAYSIPSNIKRTELWRRVAFHSIKESEFETYKAFNFDLLLKNEILSYLRLLSDAVSISRENDWTFK